MRHANKKVSEKATWGERFAVKGIWGTAGSLAGGKKTQRGLDGERWGGIGHLLLGRLLQFSVTCARGFHGHCLV